MSSALNLEVNGRPTQSEHEFLLNSQLSLELQLRQCSQELLNNYRSTQDWASVSQLAQSLVTNSQRIATLKELLSKKSGSSVSPFLLTIRESKSPELEKTITDIQQIEIQEHLLSTTDSSYTSRSSSEEPLLSLFDKEEELLSQTETIFSKHFKNTVISYFICINILILSAFNCISIPNKLIPSV